LTFNIISLIFDDEPTASTLLHIAIFMAFFWGVFFAIANPIIAFIVREKQWLRTSSDREYELNREVYKALGLNFESKDEYFEFNRGFWPNMQLIIFQHIIGGSLCLPSVLGLLDDSTSSSLACLGIMSEIGWEIQDIITMVYKRYFLPHGEILVPKALFTINLLHHSLATVLGVPLILRYRNLKVMHWICLDLQAAGALGLGVSEYTKLLDVTIPSQLLQFQVLTFLTLVLLIWTRIFHWFYLMGNFMILWYDEKAWTFLIVGTIICGLFTIFSVFVIIVPIYNKFKKFLKKKAEHQSLPADVDDKTKRGSLLMLQEVAADVHKNTNFDDILALFQNGTEVTMRRTMPPSSTLRRSSMMLLTSSEMRQVMRRIASEKKNN